MNAERDQQRRYGQRHPDADDQPVVVAPVITSDRGNGTVGSAFSYQISATNRRPATERQDCRAGLTVNTTTG